MFKKHGGPDRPRRVLIVDDDAILRSAMALGAEDAGCVVEQARSGNKAITMISEDNRFDVVITDTRMDDGDGILLLEYLYKNYGAGTRAVTHILSSFDSYTIDEVSVKLPAFIPERFPGTEFALKEFDLMKQIEVLLGNRH